MLIKHMKILLSHQIREADAYTIANEPILDINLMERASRAITDCILRKYQNTNSNFVVIIGQGNNGGDGLAVARMLADAGFHIDVYLAAKHLSVSAKTNLNRLDNCDTVTIKTICDKISFPELKSSDIVIDALFGSGINGEVSGLYLDLIQYINVYSHTTIAIDIPSGLFPENNSTLYSSLETDFQTGTKYFRNAIRADFTITLEMPFLSFLFPETEANVGHFEVVQIGLHSTFIENANSELYLINKEDVMQNIAKRNKFSHKGTFGHGLLIAGSYGKMGAAVLASKACLRTGIGLLTTHIPKAGYEIIQSTVIEAMASVDGNDKIISEIPNLTTFDAVGIGSGIGKSDVTKKALIELLEKTVQPIVFDADALNLLSEMPEKYDKLPDKSILTPHPKEFERLNGSTSNHYERFLAQKEFARKYNSIVIIKGAHTAVALPNGYVFFNTTGNPGIATAGSGDVLTGIILSFLAQGYSSEMAAIIGVYVHGLAADIALEKSSVEALIASDVIDNLGVAFRTLKTHER